MTQPREGEEPTGYLADAGAPTELAGVADAHTQAAHAWAFDEDPERSRRDSHPGGSRRSRSPRRWW